MQSLPKGHFWRIVLCFTAIYLIWGSTYLAIKHAIDAIPPFLMSGCRFLLASSVLFAIGLVRRERFPSRAQRRLAMVSGVLLVLANALVGFAEQHISTGRASVIVGTVPVWIIMFQWAFFKGVRPTAKQILGIGTALAGILLLTSAPQGAAQSSLIGIGVLLGSVMFWSLGTLIQRQAAVTGNFFAFASLQLFCGGLVIALSGLFFERPDVAIFASLEWGAVLAFLYLVIFGSVVAFSAYVWLSMHVEPAKVSTYALVNPLVAVWLGWLFNDEPVYLTMIFSSVLILSGLYLVLFKKVPALTPINR